MAWICAHTHVVDVLALDGDLGEEVKLGELDPVLLDCLGIILSPNLGKELAIATDGCEVGCSPLGTGQVLPANRGQ